MHFNRYFAHKVDQIVPIMTAANKNKLWSLWEKFAFTKIILIFEVQKCSAFNFVVNLWARLTKSQMQKIYFYNPIILKTAQHLKCFTATALYIYINMIIISATQTEGS